MIVLLCSSLHVLDVVDCNMPYICENASISVYPHDCDEILHDSLGVVKIPNVKLLKKKAKKFHENLSKFICENDDLIAKLNESNKLVEKYKKFAKHSLEKLKKFEYLNVDLNAKLVVSNELVNDLKCENESLNTHAKCLIVKPIAENEDVICCNCVVKNDFVSIVSSTSKDKSMSIPLHRNQKVERNALKPKPSFRSHFRDLNGSKFVPTCHHCGVINHIRSQYFMLKREQNYIVKSLTKKLSGPKYIVCHHCGAFGHLRHYYSKF